MPDHTLPRATAQTRLELLFTQARSASLAALIGAFICAAYFYSANPSTPPLIWLVAAVFAGGLRLVLYRRFFRTDRAGRTENYWLRRHTVTAFAIGIVWGALPMLPIGDAPGHVREIQILAPGFILMAAIVSYGVYLGQYLVLLLTMGITVIVSRLWVGGLEGLPTALLFILLMPVLALTAKRYSELVQTNLTTKNRLKTLVDELTVANEGLRQQNEVLARQQDMLEREEALAQHVFKQLTLGGDHELPGIYTWNQSMGSLSGDLTQTARGPTGQVYVFLGDFTGHGLPAALGALPTSSIFLAMASKGWSVEAIAAELNARLRELLPIGYFCCAAVLELSADRHSVHIWNGGLPPVLIRRKHIDGYDRIESRSLPLGVAGEREFNPSATRCVLQPGDLVYAYSDGLTEAENSQGEQWGRQRLEAFLQRSDLGTPRLPALIDAVLEHVNQAPASDDISVIEIAATPTENEEADAA